MQKSVQGASLTPGAVWQLVDTRGVGGVETHITGLIRSFSERGLPMTAVLWQRYDGNPWVARLGELGLPHVELDGTFGTLVRAMREGRPGLVQTHGYKANILGRLAARITGRPVVSTFHTGSREPFPVNLYDMADEITSFIAPRIAVSEGVARRNPWGAEVIANYIRLPEGEPAASLPRRIALVGRLHYAKWPEFFCELARRHRASARSDVTWHVYGDGPLLGPLSEQYAADVTFHGLVGDMDRVWPEIGLLVMCSRYEGLPYAALEAMARGIPVLANRVGGLPSVISAPDLGWLVEPGDYDASLAAVARWETLDAGAQTALRQRCRQHIAVTFSEESILPRIIEVYRRAGLRTV
jgi:glycosyltransferase involved in cell wall biosynthesis